MENVAASDIFSYTSNERDHLIENPYLLEIMELKDRLDDIDPAGMLRMREELVSRYAFSIPTIDVLHCIAGYSPFVEVGAGSGYWAFCLNQLGADIICFDRVPPDDAMPWPWGSLEDENVWFHAEWYPVLQGDEQVVRLHGDRTLFLSWPAFHTPMASRALENFLLCGGTNLIYIGDDLSCGDDRFHALLTQREPVVNRKLPGWPGIDDFLRIYEWNQYSP